MTPGEIMKNIEHCKIALQKGNDELKTLGVKKGKAEMEYRIALRKKLLYLRQVDKLPVAIISDIAKGDEEISRLRFTRDISEMNFQVCIEAMRNLRLELEAYRSFLTYARAEYFNS